MTPQRVDFRQHAAAEFIKFPPYTRAPELLVIPAINRAPDKDQYRLRDAMPITATIQGCRADDDVAYTGYQLPPPYLP